MINKSLLREHQKIDSSLNLEYNNVYDLLSTKVKENNKKIFLICPGKDNDQFTYSEFKAIVDQTSKFLIQSGLKKNDKISLIFISPFTGYLLGRLYHGYQTIIFRLFSK